MRYFPICLNVKNKFCVVVGGGKVAERKVKALLASGGKVQVISPEITEGIQDLHTRKEIAWLARSYQPGDVLKAFLVIAATDDQKVQEDVFEEAEAANVLVNVADVPEKCNFILPATVKRGDFSISISTAGKSPAMARKVRKQLEQDFGDEYGTLINILGAMRPVVLGLGRPHTENKKIFEQLLDDELIHWVKQHNWQAVETHFQKVLGPAADLKGIRALQTYFNRAGRSCQ